ncbi:hypothetical protein R1flu_009314 [Riccia fluitans]|uniref:Uncharacterized protein n=1 Tax=Riccia fluitans TaxID=41844 RepID=A0ABD1Z1R6_9MARC
MAQRNIKQLARQLMKRFNEANNHQNVEENRRLKTQKRKPKAAVKEWKQTKEKAQTKASDDKLQQENEHLPKLRAERIWRACTTPQSIEVRDVDNILFGIDTPVYFQTGSEGSHKEENEHHKQQANEGPEDSGGPANDDAMSRIPIVDLDRNIDSGADLDRVWDALLYARFGVGMMNTSNNDVKQEKPMDELPDYLVHALVAHNSPGSQWRKSRNFSAKNVIHLPELGTKPLLPPNYQSPAAMAVADLGTVMFHAGEAGVGGMLGDWVAVMIQSFWHGCVRCQEDLQSTPRLGEVASPGSRIPSQEEIQAPCERSHSSRTSSKQAQPQFQGGEVVKRLYIAFNVGTTLEVVPTTTVTTTQPRPTIIVIRERYKLKSIATIVTVSSCLNPPSAESREEPELPSLRDPCEEFNHTHGRKIHHHKNHGNEAPEEPPLHRLLNRQAAAVEKISEIVTSHYKRTVPTKDEVNPQQARIGSNGSVITRGPCRCCQKSDQAEMHPVKLITNSTISPIPKPHRKHRDHQFEHPQRPPPSSTSEFKQGPTTKTTIIMSNEPAITHHYHQAALVETGDRIEFAAGAESLRAYGSMYMWHVHKDFL